MIITEISTARGYHVSYISKVNDVPQQNTIKSLEWPRQEFFNAWNKLENEFFEYLGDETEQFNINENRVVGIDKITVKYKSEKALSFTISGDIQIFSKRLTYKSGDIFTSQNDKLTEAVKNVCIEAEKYAKGQRAQGVLFEEEPEGNFENINDKNGEIMHALPPTKPKGRAI